MIRWCRSPDKHSGQLSTHRSLNNSHVWIGILHRDKDMAIKTNTLLLSLLLSLSFAPLALSASDNADCVYTAYVRTGSIWKGGTNSNISLRLYDSYGEYVEISNLEAWGGLMGPYYSYFDRGNLDIFSGRAPCLSYPVCAMNLTSDGSGSHHGWYCNYVEITTTGVHTPCAQVQFTVEQWLALDTSPYKLTAIRNYCPDVAVGNKLGGRVTESNTV